VDLDEGREARRLGPVERRADLRRVGDHLAMATHRRHHRCIGTTSEVGRDQSVGEEGLVDGLDVALHGRKASRVYAKKADGDFEAHLVALSCSKPPEGFARWTLRLLADKVVELQYIDSVSHETVRRVLKKTNSSLGSGKDG